MLTKIKENNKKKKENKIFRTAQDTLPYIKAYEDGIFKIKNGFYSKVYKFEDINYQIAPFESQKKMFLEYCGILNSLDDRATYQLSIVNTPINVEELEENVLIKAKDDGLNIYREEYNDMLLEKITTGDNDIRSDKYMTVTVEAKDVEQARKNLARNENNILQGFANLGSDIGVLTLEERIKLYQRIYKNEEDEIIEMKEHKKEGISTKDLIAPDGFKFNKGHTEIEDKYCQSVFITSLPSYLKDYLLTELTDLNYRMSITVNIESLPPDEAQKLIRTQITGMESDVMKIERDSIKNKTFRAYIPHKLRDGLTNAEHMLDDVSNKDQKLFFVNIILTHFADSLEELEEQFEELNTITRRHVCRLRKLNWQQEDGLCSSIPLGNNRLQIERTLTTETTAIFLPFTSQEFNDPNGMYYGVNPISQNMILINRKNLKNANGFILGVSGSGKSFASKREMLNILLNTDDDIIIIDPEREYGKLVHALNGEVVEISSNSNKYINPMDLTMDSSETENPLIFKTEFILSFCEMILGELSPITKSIIDRCTRLTYKDLILNNFKGEMPTLIDFYNVIKEQTEDEARYLAVSLEMYVKGHLSAFSKKSNIDIDSRFISFDILDLGPQLKGLGLLVVLDAIWNRIVRNKNKNKHTWIYIDEIYLLFQNNYSREFLFELYKRARKYGGIPTGMTQNINDLLVDEKAETMLANSEFVLMLSQAETDLNSIDRLYHLSNRQSGFLRNARKGNGLIKYGGSVLPFNDTFPKNTKLFNLMQTDVKEEKLSNGYKEIILNKEII